MGFSQSFGQRSIWAVLFGNLITLLIAWRQQWPVGYLMWPFWLQSVLLGLLHIRRLIKLQKFCTEGFLSNGKPVANVPQARIDTAMFFAAHYPRRSS